MTTRREVWHVADDDLHRYADGTMTTPLLWSVEAHLGACPHCRARLTAVTEPLLVDIGWARIDATLDAPVPGPIERLLLALGVPDHTGRLLAATPALRLSWLSAVAGTLVLTVLLASLADPIVFVAIAPLLPVIGVAASFGPGIDPTYEVALVAPMHGFRLLLLRCAAVVTTNATLAALAAAFLPDAGLTALGWFLPSLALTVIALLLMPRLGPVRAGIAVGLGWVLLVATTAGAPFTVGGQVVAAVAAVAAAVALGRSAAAFDTSRLFHRSITRRL